ncbi:MAG: hypothetical protein JXA72_09605 [Bacteroidales bacterium]|nr:hypothetical protein [Bacteroidales bacterium]
MKNLLVICLIFQSVALFGQEVSTAKHKVKIGAGFSYFPVTEVMRYLGRDEGVPEIDGKAFYSAGITGVFSLKKNLSMASGVFLSQYRVKVDPYELNQPNFNENISVLYVPLSLRFNFGKHVYFSTGLLFGFDFSNPGELKNQTGIGMILSPGVSFDCSDKISFFLNPYLNLPSMVSFNYGLNNDRILEASIRLGFLYQL